MNKFWPGVLALLLACFPEVALAGGAWTFEDVTLAAGFSYEHGYVDEILNEPRAIAGGVAAGDFDGDGLVDLYVVRGDIGPNLLFKNLGAGLFSEVGSSAGLDLDGETSAGPLFADLDGDGDLDLFLGALAPSLLRLFENLGDGTFTEVTSGSGLPIDEITYSCSAADYDGDGDLDLFLSHWSSDTAKVLWRNEGGLSFVDATTAIPLASIPYTFAVNFADINGDRHPDLLVAADFGSSEVLLNDGSGGFVRVTDGVISDENGMGAAVGDYDNDGDLDWFVSSIWDPNGSEGGWGVTGNRLYRNLGGGLFEDATDEAGVREGYWGWGSCFADFDNDGDLDLFQVNGFNTENLCGGCAPEFDPDPSRFFVNQGDGTFLEQSLALGIDDQGQGRGVVCADFDRDGTIDIFVANNSGPPKLWRNNGEGIGNYLAIRLRGPISNRFGIGARVEIEAGGLTQVREIRAGSNYASQNPTEAHFGIGALTLVEKITVYWPNGSSSTVSNVSANELVEIESAEIFADGFEAGDLSRWSGVTPSGP